MQGGPQDGNETTIVRKRKYLSAEEKFQIFLEATMAKAKDNGSVSEVLRRWGIHASDLVRIKKTVEQGSLEAFGERKSRKPKVDYEAHQNLQAENQRLEAVILEQKEQDLMERRTCKPREPQKKLEVKPTKPNEIWSWDLTYLALGPMVVYLFAILDVYSRKMVAWYLSLNATVESMKRAWDQALTSEGLLGVREAPRLPVALSDHGVQMAKKTARQFFRDLEIGQLFARYQIPTDNSWIESWFRVLKYDWLRFKDYVSFDELKIILGEFVQFYNTQRYHGAIEYVTPEQRHTGADKTILAQRAERRLQARKRRLEINGKLKDQASLAPAA